MKVVLAVNINTLIVLILAPKRQEKGLFKNKFKNFFEATGISLNSVHRI